MLFNFFLYKPITLKTNLTFKNKNKVLNLKERGKKEEKKNPLLVVWKITYRLLLRPKYLPEIPGGFHILLLFSQAL